jgi:glutamyl-tRNA synthetase
VGSARTALFNWLYARHTGGELVLRIEDTNAELATPEFIDNIYRSLEWLGIDWDGEPVRQSQRGELYQEAVERLLAGGDAYLDDGAVRFRVPEEGSTAWPDVIRGEVTFENRHIEDFVIRRSDGSTTFFLANAVDDADLGITDVIRGEDLLNVTPKVLLLRAALGVPGQPRFAHLPLIVGEDRRKLSKRRHAVAVEDFRDQGYLAEAMANYLALLGWGPPDGVEIRPLREIVELFDVADINQAPAAFDVKKLTHINGEYIRALALDDFVERTRSFLPAPVDDRVLVEVAPLVQERVKTLADVWPHLDFFFLGEPDLDPDAWQKVMATEESPAILADAAAAYEDSDWTAETLHEVTRRLGEARGLKLGKAQAPIRVAVTGRTVGPPLFESLVVLGRETTLERIRAARARLS